MDQASNWMQMLKTQEIVNYINELDLLHNWWFIGGAVLFLAICLFMKWRLLLTTTISLTALIGLITYIGGRGTDLEQSSDGIFIFVGGGAAIMFFFIYMIFMRSE